MVCGEFKSAYVFYILLSLQHHLNNAPNITRPTFMVDTSYSYYTQPHYTKLQTLDMKLVSGVFILFHSSGWQFGFPSLGFAMNKKVQLVVGKITITEVRSNSNTSSTQKFALLSFFWEVGHIDISILGNGFSRFFFKLHFGALGSKEVLRCSEYDNDPCF